MDPVSLIVAALVAGAAAGAGETATAAVKDAYAGLKKLLFSKFADRRGAEVVLVEHEQDPETYSAPMRKTLETTGAAQDQEVIRAAQQLLALADPAGTEAGSYQVDLRGSQGVQVGGVGNQQTNTFNNTPPPPVVGN